MNKRIGVILASAVAVASLASCGGGDKDYTKADFVKDLQEEGGLTEEQATCVADGLEGRGFDLKQLGKRVDEDAAVEDVLSEEDLATLTEVSTECVSPTG